MSKNNKNYSQSQINWFYGYTANKLKALPDYNLHKYFLNTIFNYILKNSDFTDDEIIRCYNITNGILEKYGQINQKYINFMFATIENVDNLDRKLDASLLIYKKLEELDLLSTISTNEAKEIINGIIENDIPTKFVYKSLFEYDFSRYSKDNFINFMITYKKEHSNLTTDFATTKEIRFKYGRYSSQLDRHNLPSESAARLDTLISCLVHTFPNILFSFHQFKAVFDIIEKYQLSKQQITDLIIGQKTLNRTTSKYKPPKGALTAIIEKEKENLDIDTYSKINNLQKIFTIGTVYRKNGIIKTCIDAIREHNQRANAQLENFTEEEFSSLEAFGQLLSDIRYNVTKFIGKNENESSILANEIIEKLAEYYKEHTNAILTKEQATTFTGLMQSLMKKPFYNSKGSERFTASQMADFISNNLSLVFTADYEKAIVNRNILVWYMSELYKNTQDYKSLDTAIQLPDETAKNIIIRNSAILNELNTNLYESLQFLLGNEVSQIYENTLNDKENLNVKYGNKRKTRDALCSLFPNLKITNMTADKHLELIQDNPQILSKLTLDRLYTTTEKIIKAICKAYNLCDPIMSLKEQKRLVEDLGFDTNTLFNGDNIISVFTKFPSDTLHHNIQILSEYLSPRQIQEIIRHNFDLLLLNPNILLAKIKQLDTNSSDEIFNQLLAQEEMETPSNLEELEKYAQIWRVNIRYSKDSIATPLTSIRSYEYKTPQDVQLQLDRKLQILEDEIVEDTRNGNNDSITQIKERINSLIDSLNIKKEVLRKRLQESEDRSSKYYKIDRVHKKDYSNSDDDYLSVVEALNEQIANCNYDVSPSDIPSQLEDIKASAHERFVHERQSISRIDRNITNIRLEISMVEKIIARLECMPTIIDDTIKSKELADNIDIIEKMFDRLLQILQKDIPDDRKSREIKRAWTIIIFANKKIIELTGISLLDTSLDLPKNSDNISIEI